MPHATEISFYALNSWTRQSAATIKNCSANCLGHLRADFRGAWNRAVKLDSIPSK